jgi:solute carrier family 25 phosphate transporter 23/24/25/41
MMYMYIIVGEYNSIFSVVGQIMKDNNGFRGLYRGLVPSVLGIVPYAGIDLMVFFTLKERWVAQNKTKMTTPGVLTLVSIVSLTCRVALIYQQTAG